MKIIPAIDIRQGKCVRLYQGDYNNETVFSDNPAKVASEFERAGAERLHVVDLDAAVTGKPQNLKVISSICEKTTVPVQFGGGICDYTTAKSVIDAGFSQVILGTILIKEPDKARELVLKLGIRRVYAGIDYSDGYIAVSGWKTLIKSSVIDEIRKWQSCIKRFILTNVKRDGTMSGPDIGNLQKFAETSDVNITASGGVSSTKDIDELEKIEQFGIDSVIVGRAIYEGRVNIGRYNYAD